MDKRYYTTREIAELLKVKVKTVQKWLCEGKLDGVQVGRRWRITEVQVDKFLGNHS